MGIIERETCRHVCPFTKMKRCRKLYYPGKQSVDKNTCVKWQLYFKLYIYIRTKRAFWNKTKLTSSRRITSDLLVNRRKAMFDIDNKNSDMPIIKKIPIYLLRPYLDKGHIP